MPSVVELKSQLGKKPMCGRHGVVSDLFVPMMSNQYCIYMPVQMLTFKVNFRNIGLWGNMKWKVHDTE